MPNVIDYDTRRNGGPHIRRLPVKPAASFKKGQFLIATATGLDGPPTAGTNYGAGGFPDGLKIAGKALGDSVDTTGGGAGVNVPFMDIEIAEPGTQFPIALYHSTPASAVASLAQLIAPGYELKSSALIGGISIPQIDLTATTNIAGRVVDFVITKGGVYETPFWPTNVNGAAQFGLAWFEFRGAACAFTGAR